MTASPITTASDMEKLKRAYIERYDTPPVLPAFQQARLLKANPLMEEAVTAVRTAEIGHGLVKAGG